MVGGGGGTSWAKSSWKLPAWDEFPVGHVSTNSSEKDDGGKELMAPSQPPLTRHQWDAGESLPVMCSELRKIHEKFEALRGQLDADAATRSFASPSSTLQHRMAQATKDTPVVTNQPLVYPVDSPNDPSWCVETPHLLDKKTGHGVVATAPTTLHRRQNTSLSMSQRLSHEPVAQPLVSSRGHGVISHTRSPRTAASTTDNGRRAVVTAEQEDIIDGIDPASGRRPLSMSAVPPTRLTTPKAPAALDQFQTLWHVKVATLDDMMASLQDVVARHKRGCDWTLYVQWLVTQVEHFLQSEPGQFLLAAASSSRGEMTLADVPGLAMADGTCTATRPSGADNDAAAALEACLAMVLHATVHFKDTYDTKLQRIKASWSKKVAKASQEAQLQQTKNAELITMVHQLQDERNVLQGKLQAEIQRAASLEKELLVTQSTSYSTPYDKSHDNKGVSKTLEMTIAKLEQETRDKSEQLRLQQEAWQDEVGRWNQRPATRQMSVGKSKWAPRERHTVDDTMQSAASDELWREWWDESVLCEPEPIPRPHKLPRPVAPIAPVSQPTQPMAFVNTSSPPPYDVWKPSTAIQIMPPQQAPPSHRQLLRLYLQQQKTTQPPAVGGVSQQLTSR
ncbi:Aste57867_11593 [Aphanomyces stellatus]|uniref:Aste57867_11593 protein n=1 Tax=Aphanomyces stellatus TaxID=120398 RepID=A0A485KTP1_9STRA|nr:hypothetical protein As57867_011550 [Aphanomyces stellatus]VFT88452.1 Aste57867_11593 [Aphanomyces stellatus]